MKKAIYELIKDRVSYRIEECKEEEIIEIIDEIIDDEDINLKFHERMYDTIQGVVGTEIDEIIESLINEWF